MEVKRLSNRLSVCTQISVDDIEAIKAQGFGAIICNRPDDETEGQPSFETIAKAAEAVGLEISHIPVIGGQISDADVALFEAAADHLPTPILAYCRTGTRCTILWSLSQAGQQSADDIVASAKAAGYDMSAQVERMNNKTKN